ncbi:hypothetical protein MWN62_14170, partial [Marivivens donghaensis]|nr:hypothetical protein [Marivivens donghaensis]
MTLDFLTILHGDQPSAKQVNRSLNDEYEILAAGTSFRHSLSSIPVTSLSDLYQALSELQSYSERFVIRGSLIKGRPTEGIRRTLRPKVDEPANFQPASRRWVMLDVDDVPMPEGLVDPNMQADDIIQHVISLLPVEFQHTSCIYQWSGSMGFKLDLIRVHLWFWLDRAVTDVELKDWLHDAPVDHALFNPVQVHYTANPILEEGISDPIKNRLGSYMPKDGKATVLVPEVITPRSYHHTVKPTQFISSNGIVDPQGIIRDAKSGLVIDGRERFLLLKSNDAVKELMRGNSDRRNDPDLETIAKKTWALFSAEADLSDGEWSYDDALWEAQRRHFELANNTYDFLSRNDATLLEPCSSPYVELNLVSKEEGQAQLEAALSAFFQNIDKGPRLALRITMGAGKTRATIHKLQSYLQKNMGKIVEVYVPRHDLAEQYVKDIHDLEGKFCAKVIHILGRYNPHENSAERPDLCVRRDYVESLTKVGVGVYNHACFSNNGEVCSHYDTCPYIQQFKDVDLDVETRGNVVRILPHSYLGLARNPIQKRNMPDLVIIDEAFVDELIDTKTELSPSDIKKHIKTKQHPKLGRLIVDALEYKEPLLKQLREQGVTKADLQAVNLDLLKPSCAFSSDQTKAIKMKGDNKLHRSLSLLLKVLQDELSLEPLRGDVERVVYNPHSETIRLSCLKEIEFPSTTPILCLDATADEMLLKEILGEVKVHRIDVHQKAVVTQVYNSTGSKKFWSGTTAPVQRLVDIANVWADFGETPLIVCHKELADDLGRRKELNDAVKVMHFGGLRGSNDAETCSVIFITGRNLPQMAEIDLKARALFWSSNVPLQHDKGAQFNEADVMPTRPVEQVRGFVQSNRNSHPQSGVRVMSFSDERIDRLLAQTRDAETLQALGRLRLVHSPYQKKVFLLSNLPVEIPVDHFAKLNQLIPDQLEQQLLAFGNLPLSPLGMQKMRPDIGQSENQSAKLL